MMYPGVLNASHALFPSTFSFKFERIHLEYLYRCHCFLVTKRKIETVDSSRLKLLVKDKETFIVGCRGLVQLGGYMSWKVWTSNGGLLKSVV